VISMLRVLFVNLRSDSDLNRTMKQGEIEKLCELEYTKERERERERENGQVAIR